MAGGLLETEEWLTKLNWLAILGTNFGNNSRDLGFDLVHDLHGFDDTNHCVWSDLLADRKERRGFR
jgi:hypothetical protein